MFFRFPNLLQETVFLNLRNEYYAELDDMPWLIDLGFLTEVSLMPNGMNLKMQGQKSYCKNDQLNKYIQVQIRKSELKSHLGRKSLLHF
jgi:hypothetical protein